jgi:hypothetical protein
VCRGVNKAVRVVEGQPCQLPTTMIDDMHNDIVSSRPARYPEEPNIDLMVDLEVDPKKKRERLETFVCKEKINTSGLAENELFKPVW